VNVGVLLPRVAYVASLMSAYAIDFLFVSETLDYDGIEIRAALRRLGLSYRPVFRQLGSGRVGNDEFDGAATHAPRVGGGIAAIFPFGRRFRVEEMSANSRGGASYAIHSDGYESAYVIGLYLPPIGSKRAHWRQGLIDYATAEYNRLRAKFRVVAAIGDFNGRLGTMGGTRFTDDHVISAGNSLLRDFTAHTGTRPAAGRSRETRGQLTCHAPSGIGGWTESDYVFLPATWDGRDYSVLRQQDRSILPNNHVHMLIGASINLRPLANVTVPSLPTSRRKFPNYAIEPYTSPRYLAAGAYQLDAIAGVESLVNSNARVDTILKEYSNMCDDSMAACMPPVTSGTRTQRFRSLANGPISSASVAALQLARHLRELSQKLNRLYATDGIDCPAATAIKAEAVRLVRSVRATERDTRKSWLSARVHDMQGARPDAHNVYGLLSSVTSAINHNVAPVICGSEPIDGVAAIDAQRKYYIDLLGDAKPMSSEAQKLIRQYMPTLPLSVGAVLTRECTWEEVWLIVFPATKRFQPRPCTPSCILCDTYINKWQHWRDDPTELTPAPKHNPHLSTSTASGHDGVPPEAFVWPRTENLQSRYDLRKRHCSILAAIFNAALAGDFPGSFDPSVTMSIITAIPKPTPPGQASVPGLAGTRGLGLMNTAPKIISLIWTCRLQHYLTNNGIISPAQIGFVPMHGSEQHVHTALQCISARLRDGLDTHNLWLDISKAYDKVNRDAMNFTLLHIGVPTQFVNLLASWSESSRACVNLNGILSHPFAVRAGLPQGAPPSCPNFITFIECLSRMYAAHGIALPVPALGGIRVPPLLFADDISCMTDSHHDMQRAADITSQWGNAFGMKFGIGGGKTEYGLVSAASPGFHASDDNAEPITILQGNEILPVPRTRMYKYLGYMLSLDLSTGTYFKRMMMRARLNYHRIFARNSIVRRLPVFYQLELFRTAILGSINYLRAIIRLNAEQHNTMDTFIKHCARRIIGLPPRCSNVLVWRLSQLLTTKGTNAREQERVAWQLYRSPFSSTSLSGRITHLLRNERRTRLSAYGPFSNWAHATARARNADSKRGAKAHEPKYYADTTRVANLRGLAVTLNQLASEMRKMPVYTIGSTPETVASKEHTAALLFSMSFDPSELRSTRGTIPLSIIGFMLPLATRSRYPAVTFALCGHEALYHPPFVKRGAPYKCERFGDIFVRRPCALCGTGQESIYHLVHDCMSQPMAAFRVEQHASLSAIIASLIPEAMRIKQACGNHCTFTPHTQEEAMAVDAAASGTYDFSSADGRFVGYWLLMSTAWHRKRAGPQHPLAAAFGRFFDDCAAQRRDTQSFANTLLAWSESRLQLLGARYLAASSTT